MTDVSSVTAHADPQPPSVAPYGGPPPPAYLNGSPALDGVIEEEESSTIKCICGFSDDDGDTVLCEKCDTWQHIVCYYNSPGQVPDVHLCTDCLPRSIDVKAAADKQRLRREAIQNMERRARPRTTTKSHKKRVKDPLGPAQPNGWAVQSNSDFLYHSERKSGSPRDQPPPAKRPKTSHRPSGSVNAINQTTTLTPASRKRGASLMLNGHSPVKSPTNPDGLIEEFSLEFMNLYSQSPQSEPKSPISNSYTDLGVTNDIASWLNDRDALAEATGGMLPGHVFQRIEQSIEDLSASHAPIITKQRETHHGITAHGQHPKWLFLTVETPVADGGFIGELKGRIGRIQDYYTDAFNRWELLRHPEPFVFFPPHLPIYIDTRHEGSTLRYARRSCKPNMVMKILTQGPESGHHFCFVASGDIDAHEELTVGWDIDSAVRQQLEKAVTNGEIKKEGFKKIQPWVATVLANFGGCACDTSEGYECLLERARRNAPTYSDLQPPKTKGRRQKKAQVSPLSTGHATNSRAGSEVYPREMHDDDNDDGRSTSGSRKCSSRDITPATHLSVDESKMSERERRKIQQQERLFEQMAYDEQSKGRRGKRNSAGSTLNTPSLSSSKQLGHPEPSPSFRHPREQTNGVPRKPLGNTVRPNGRPTPKPKPVYVDSSTQTTEEKHTLDSATGSKGRPSGPPLSFKRKLLQQAQEDKLRRERVRSASVKVEAKSPALKDVSSSKASPVTQSAPLEEPDVMDTSAPDTDAPALPEAPLLPQLTAAADAPDVDMKDADEVGKTEPVETKAEDLPDAPSPESSPESSHPAIQPPAPPWDASTSTAPQKPALAQLEMPTKSDLASPTASLHTVVTPGSASSAVTGGAIAHSPTSITAAPSPFSPAVTNAVTPGPARKKLSLSAYTSRRAKLAQQTSGPPALSQSHSTSSPTLTTASLPNNGSPSSKSVDSTLPSVSEEAQAAEPSAPAASAPDIATAQVPPAPATTTSTSTST